MNSFWFFLVVPVILVALVYLYLRFAPVMKARQLYRSAQVSKTSLVDFLELLKSKRKYGVHYLFNEQLVRSSKHRIVGRFDSAVLHWVQQGPVLDQIIEFKFPTKILPDHAYSHDLFQAGLYALALEDHRVNTDKAQLVLVYCLQKTAEKCLSSSNQGCLMCGKGRVFVKSFDRKGVLRDLKRLDQIWFDNRRPRASPSGDKCIACPYSHDHSCKYSAV